MSFFSDILAKLGAVVDAIVPVAHGDRTKIAALIAVVAPVVCTALTPVFPPACAVVDGLGKLAATLVPVFAGAGLFRKS